MSRWAAGTALPFSRVVVDTRSLRGALSRAGFSSYNLEGGQPRPFCVGRAAGHSMPVSSSASPASPPQPSWRMRARSWRGHFRRDGHELRRRQRGPQSGGSPLPLVARDIVWRAVFSFRARDIERGPWCLLLCAAVIRALLRARRISIVRDGGSRDQHDKGGRTYHRRSPSDRG